MTWNDIWLELYLISFGANILIAMQLMARKWIKQRRVLQLLNLMLAIGSVLILTVDGINLLNSFEYRKLQPWSHFPLVGTALGISWLSIRALFTATSKTEVRLLSAILSVLLLILNCWSWQRLNRHAVESDFAIFMRMPGTIVEESRFAAFTRAGSPVPLYRLDADPDDFSNYAAAIQEQSLLAAEPIIDLEEPSMECNCHGWVFTGGKHFLRGSEVELILKDNAYQSIEEPAENDIAIYRSDDGRILHTGLVRVVLQDGTTIIESKWGAAGRYLHRPENQPYSTLIEYYRGCGPSHLIQMKEVKTTSDKELLSKMGMISS